MSARPPMLRSLAGSIRSFASSSTSFAPSGSAPSRTSNAIASSSSSPSSSAVSQIPPRSLSTTLSAIRSSVFQSAHNPTAERTGAKYLRRRLRGPSMMRYYPKLPTLRALNAVSPYNPYVNWEGLPPSSWSSIGSEYGSAGQQDKWKERAWGHRVLMGNEVVEEGYAEVERIRGAGWLDDAKERLRGEEVVVRRLMGKGPPKKGQGKRSQMKKR